MSLRRLLPCALLLVAGCSGRTLATSEPADMFGVKPPAPPANHRPVASACMSDAGPGECTTDGDCTQPAANACACDATGGFRVFAACHVDSDCGVHGYCSPSYQTIDCGSTSLPNSYVSGFYCHTSADACNNDSDCPTSQTCAYSPEAPSKWVCTSAVCNG